MNAVALMGATGVGKSSLALELAEFCDDSIISCDSMQVYRGLDIGTAKPNPDEQARVNHHLINCADIHEVYSAARWAEDAKLAIQTENSAGRIPIICGGTGLYLKALLSGLANIPPEDPDVRRNLTAEMEADGIQALHARLAIVDAETALRLHTSDTQRIMRALAVYRTTGRPLSSWQTDDIDVETIECPVYVLELPRNILRRRLEERFHAMIEAGWVEEVRWLVEQNLKDTHPAMRAVGYRQLLPVVRGESSLDEGVMAGITATHQYAKRQDTWFRGQVQGIHGDVHELRTHILDVLSHET